MKIYFNGFYSGFLDCKNPGTTIKFFIYLFKKIYDTDEIILGNIEDSDILCEFDMLINTKTLISIKKWKHTYLFNGEYKCLTNTKNYDCVLFGERNNNNIINLPLYISYMFSNDIKFDYNKLYNIPKKNICVVISNPNGIKRNYILDKIEKHFNIDYLGKYKNNCNILKAEYNSNEFKEKISEYKFIIAIENNRYETYITEKIILGLNSKIIPIYWGSKYIYDYFNKERILALLEEDNDKLDIEIDILINKIKNIINNDYLWLDIVNKPYYPLDILNNEKESRNINDIVIDIKNLLKIDNKNYYNKISKIYSITDKIYEPINYNSLELILKNKLNLSENNIKYICPTYKNNLSFELFNKYYKSQFNGNKFLSREIKKSELSLIINYKSILEDIIKNYKDGLFIIFESDIKLNKDINILNDFISVISNIKGWDFIHIGEHNNEIFKNPSINLFNNFHNNLSFIEDITDINSKYRLIRKLHTRCCDCIIWKYEAIENFLNYMNNNNNYNLPLDYYIIKYLETNTDIKHYWSLNNFFINGSNNKMINSTIRND